MKIEGLELAALPRTIYNPIRVKITPGQTDALYMEIDFMYEGKTTTTRFYPINNQFLVEIEKWVQLFFPNNFECDLDYNVEDESGIKTINQNKNILTATLNFRVIYSNTDNNEIQAITLPFANAYPNPNNRLQSNLLQNTNRLERVQFAGYPFSLYVDSAYKNALVSNGIGRVNHPDVTYVTPSQCSGIYVRWLSYDTNYNYWLFPIIEEKETTKEIGEKDRWFLKEENETSNEDTLGLTAVKEFTLKGVINKKYWNLINTIFRSPDVCILTVTPEQEDFYYELNAWQKVRIKGQTYENKSFQEAQTYSIDFIYRKQYTQTL